MYPPPPMLPASGHATASAKPSATAASTALPPACRISAAAALASGLLLTAIECGANVALAPAGKCQLAGNVAATRTGIAGPFDGELAAVVGWLGWFETRAQAVPINAVPTTAVRRKSR